MLVKYSGVEDERTITKSDWASVGVEYDTVTWTPSQRVVDLPDDAAEVALKQKFFSKATPAQAEKLNEDEVITDDETDTDKAKAKTAKRSAR